MSAPGFATSGTTNPTALNESSFGTGQQQRADVSIYSLLAPQSKTLTAYQNVYAETTFVCPSYWLTEAFTNNGRVGYKYQYSVVGAEHNRDVAAIFGPAMPNQSPDFVRAFMSKCIHSPNMFDNETESTLIPTASNLGQLCHNLQPFHLSFRCRRLCQLLFHDIRSHQLPTLYH